HLLNLVNHLLVRVELLLRERGLVGELQRVPERGLRQIDRHLAQLRRMHGWRSSLADGEARAGAERDAVAEDDRGPRAPLDGRLLLSERRARAPRPGEDRARSA